MLLVSTNIDDRRGAGCYNESFLARIKNIVSFFSAVTEARTIGVDVDVDDAALFVDIAL